MQSEYLIFALILCFFVQCSSDTKPAEKVTKTPSATAQNAVNQPKEKRKKTKSILFFGDSLTAGYGLEKAQAFPALVQEKIEEAGLYYNVINAGVSGETTAGGLRRVDWLLKNQVDVFVLELGGNDGLRGVSPSETLKNLQSIIDKVNTKYPKTKIVLAGMEAPPNMGAEFTSQFRNNYKKLAAENDVTLIPFLLEKVAGNPKFNLEDGIHPNVEGQKLVAETVWEYLKGVL